MNDLNQFIQEYPDSLLSQVHSNNCEYNNSNCNNNNFIKNNISNTAMKNEFILSNSKINYNNSNSNLINSNNYKHMNNLFKNKLVNNNDCYLHADHIDINRECYNTEDNCNNNPHNIDNYFPEYYSNSSYNINSNFIEISNNIHKNGFNPGFNNQNDYIRNNKYKYNEKEYQININEDDSYNNIAQINRRNNNNMNTNNNILNNNEHLNTIRKAHMINSYNVDRNNASYYNNHMNLDNIEINKKRNIINQPDEIDYIRDIFRYQYSSSNSNSNNKINSSNNNKNNKALNRINNELMINYSNINYNSKN